MQSNVAKTIPKRKFKMKSIQDCMSEEPASLTSDDPDGNIILID
ncbi:hypothetical protein [Oceanobacillus sp. CAU 1775]